jgi:hypothetical protein
MCCRRCSRDAAQAFPRIAIELVPSDSVENLLLREADIAVRMFRPTQLELITRKARRDPRRRLRARELPRSGAGCRTRSTTCSARPHRLRPLRPDHRHGAGMGVELKRDDFVVRTDSQTACGSC